MGLWQWSTTAANNATADPSINWQEGQAPSTVNDSARAMMAAIAAQFQTGWEWQQFGDTPTYVSGTQFSVPGNLTSRYTVGRRVRSYNTGGTLYGTITASAYSSVTTVTLQMDSGALDSGLSEVDVGILNPAAASLPAAVVPSLTVSQLGSSNYSGSLKLVGLGGYAPFMRSNGSASQLEWINSANTQYTMLLTDSGNLTLFGNLTANSDERLKRKWKAVLPDFLERLAAVKNGTYERIATGERAAGVSAQALQKAIPEAVLEGHDGFLSVAYGQAALVACVELAKEVLRLRALLEPVK